MEFDNSNPIRRRAFLGAGVASLVGMSALPALAQTADPTMQNTTEADTSLSSNVKANISSFRMPKWQDYFETTTNGVILCDLTSRAVHYWSEDLSVYKLYPSSVPLNEELTRRGKTSVIQKVENPTWIPTADEKRRHPDWPDVVPGGSPDNPLGIRALYLSWPAYRIHGTHDTRKIGRRSSNGCVGLYNEHILELYGLAKVGTQVLLI